MALILGSAPIFVFPATLALLIVLSFVSWWGISTGRTRDCGCYGGYIEPSATQSLALNGLYALLIVGGWAASGTGGGFSLPSILAPLAFFVAGASVAEFTQRYAFRNGRPLVDLNPLKVGRRFRPSWAGGLTSNIDREVIVAFLGPDCPYCKQFVTVANAMVQSPSLPRVVGVVGASKERLDAFIVEKGIRFPMATLSQSMWTRMISSVPTAALVEGGITRRLWVGNLPPDLIDRFRDAFFPAAADSPVAQL
jgi:hypothetical protein